MRQLIETVRELRHPDRGCPWDREQTFLTLVQYLREETFEYIEVLERDGPVSPETREELGDILFQIVLHTVLMEEQGLPGFTALAANLRAKLISRHPHVFEPGFPKFQSAAEVNANWELIKARSKRPPTEATSPALSKPSAPIEVPASLPALQRAARIGEKAASFGFDWHSHGEVWGKVREELAELEEVSALPTEDAHAQEEFADILFVLCQFARKRNWDPEQLLGRANEKFLRRFSGVARKLEGRGGKLGTASRDLLDALWDEVKTEEPAPASKS